MRHASFALVLLSLLASLCAVAACGDDAQPAPVLPELAETSGDEGPPRIGGKADSANAAAAYASLPEHADFDRPLTALFAPDDPVVTLELRLIDEVRAARRDDDRTFTEGDNPYAIRYAVYNLRNPDLVKALADAEDDGVDVQILIEADQLDPALDYNVSDEALVARGFELVTDHRKLGEQTRKTADLIGITGSGLMHLKTRIFQTPEGTRVLSGSMNPGDNAIFNEETLHLINAPELTARYQAAFEAVRDARGQRNVWDEGAAVNVLFTPAASGPRAASKLLTWIAEEQEQILLMVFSLREVSAPDVSESLIGLLSRKAREGVPVYVITDRKQSDGVDVDGKPLYFNDRTEDQLRAAGVHVYEAINATTPFTAMHHKVGIFGRSKVRVVTDAANWTLAGLGSTRSKAKNVESVLFIDTEALDGGMTGARYLRQWLRVAERYADQSASRDGEPGFEALHEALTSAPGWPTVPVTFEVRADFTVPGDELVVRGNRDVLSDWGRATPGVPLTTDAATFPLWRSVEPVELPLGERFSWKAVVLHANGGVSWEKGANWTDEASPLPLEGTDSTVRPVTFRR